MQIHWRWTPAVLAMGAALTTGCEPAVVAPEYEPEEYDLLWDLRFSDELAASAQHQRVAMLVRLFRNALQHIGREEGRGAAAEAMQTVARLRAEARERYHAGDLDGARAGIEEARRAMAATVIRAFGAATVHPLLAAVADRQQRLDRLVNDREAAGHDTLPLRRFADHLDRLTDDARDALERDDPAAALDYASRAAETLIRFMDRSV